MNERIRELALASQLVYGTDDALVEKIWSHCNGNPWNAVPLYNILKALEK